MPSKRHNRDWYEIRNADSETPKIYIYDDIAWYAENAKGFIDKIKGLTAKDIDVHINSGGGSMVEAGGIAAAMRHHPANMHVKIDYLAASAATLIAMAGDTIEMADNALFMIHLPSSFAIGNADDMRKEAEVLDKFLDTMVAQYQWHSSLPKGELLDMVRNETWMSADEAKENGFVTGIFSGSKAAASVSVDTLDDLSNRVPDKYADKFLAIIDRCSSKGKLPPTENLAPTKIEDKSEQEDKDEKRKSGTVMDAKAIIKMCKDCGLSDLAFDLIDSEISEAQLVERLDNAQKIRDACAAAGLPQCAEAAIKNNVPVDAVRRFLVEATASRSGDEIDNHLSSEIGPRTGLNVFNYYQNLNRSKKS